MNFRQALKEINSKLKTGYSIEVTEIKEGYGYMFGAFNPDGSSTGNYSSLFAMLQWVYIWQWFLDNDCDVYQELEVIAKDVDLTTEANLIAF